MSQILLKSGIVFHFLTKNNGRVLIILIWETAGKTLENGIMYYVLLQSNDVICTEILNILLTLFILFPVTGTEEMGLHIIFQVIFLVKADQSKNSLHVR